MKVLIVVSCALAVASAGLLSPVVSSSYHAQDELGQYSYGYTGGPSAKQESRTADGITRGGYSYVDGHGLVQSVSYVADPIHGFRAAGTNLPKAPIDPANPIYGAVHPHAIAAAPIAHAYAAAPVAYAAGYPQHLPIIGHNGVPLDTPEVVHAKAAHFAAHAEAHARNGHYIAKRSLYAAYPQHLPVIGHNGVPLDTPEVNAAKAHHFAAVAEAKVRNGDHLVHHAGPVVHTAIAAAPIAHAYAAAPAYASYGYNGAYGYHVPVIGPSGVPLDTPEVNAAKAKHFHDVAEVKARNGDLHEVPVVYAANYAAPFAYAQHVPVIGHNGVPLDTPEVNAAKAHHFAAHAEAHARTGYAGAHFGVVDTPEVSHAKAAHFAAHAEANARAHHY